MQAMTGAVIVRPDGSWRWVSGLRYLLDRARHNTITACTLLPAVYDDGRRRPFHDILLVVTFADGSLFLTGYGSISLFYGRYRGWAQGGTAGFFRRHGIEPLNLSGMYESGERVHE